MKKFLTMLLGMSLSFNAFAGVTCAVGKVKAMYLNQNPATGVFLITTDDRKTTPVASSLLARAVEEQIAVQTLSNAMNMQYIVELTSTTGSCSNGFDSYVIHSLGS